MSNSKTSSSTFITQIKNLFRKVLNRETVMYGLWGVVTSLWNVGSFFLLNQLGLDYRVSNVVALITTKLLAYYANKYFVFKSRCSSMLQALLEMLRFVLSRVFTLLIDYFLLILLVEVVHTSTTIGKIVTTVVVVTINYFFGKFFVYNRIAKKDNDKEYEVDNSNSML